MAAKPTIGNARFATDVSNNTAPSSGTRDTGWANGGTVVSSYFNALALEYYKWFQWLDDGDIDLNDVTAGTLATDTTLAVGTDLTVGDDAVITGDLTYGGNEYHPGKVVHLHFACGQSVTGSAWTRSTSAYITGTTGDTWEWPIAPETGQRITGVRLHYRYDGGVDFFTFRLRKNLTGTVTTVDTANTTTPGGGAVNTSQLLTLGTPEVVASGEFFMIEAIQSATNANMRIYGVEYIYDRIP